MRLSHLLRPRRVAHAHCDLPCGVYDPAQARIEAESVHAIQEQFQDASKRKPPGKWDETQSETDWQTRALKIKEETDVAERKRLKDLHWMHCPKCGMKLQEVKFKAVDADVCFSCGGMFLDKGELEQLQHERQPGAMAAILNWFKDETKAPGR